MPCWGWVCCCKNARDTWLIAVWVPRTPLGIYRGGRPLAHQVNHCLNMAIGSMHARLIGRPSSMSMESSHIWKLMRNNRSLLYVLWLILAEDLLVNQNTIFLFDWLIIKLYPSKLLLVYVQHSVVWTILRHVRSGLVVSLALGPVTDSVRWLFLLKWEACVHLILLFMHGLLLLDLEVPIGFKLFCQREYCLNSLDFRPWYFSREF